MPQLTEYRLLDPEHALPEPGAPSASPGLGARPPRPSTSPSPSEPPPTSMPPPPSGTSLFTLILVKASGYMLIMGWHHRRRAYDGERTAGSSARSAQYRLSDPSPCRLNRAARADLSTLPLSTSSTPIHKGLFPLMPPLAILCVALLATVAPARAQTSTPSSSPPIAQNLSQRHEATTTPPPPQTGAATPGPATASNKSEADEAEARKNINRDFLGIRFGVGLGVSLDRGPDRIAEAEVVDGILRVTRTTNHRPRILLETHYFWRVHQERVSVAAGERTITVQAADIGAGPFAAIQSSDEAVLEAFALGLMIGFKRQDDSAFNIGVAECSILMSKCWAKALNPMLLFLTETLSDSCNGTAGDG